MTGQEWYFPIVQKVTSARFWTVLFIILTLCAAVFKCLDLVTKVLSSENEKILTFVKEIIMFVLGSFTSLVSAISVLYFGREDRKEPILNGEGNGDTEIKK
jgi:hypothetical protein